MAEQKDSKGGFEIFVDRYRDIARRARKEADDAKRADDMMGARQAAEKSYLAAVHAARQILICAGITSTRKPRQSSAAIARANQLVGELGLRREEAVDKRHAGARSGAQGAHLVLLRGRLRHPRCRAGRARGGARRQGPARRLSSRPARQRRSAAVHGRICGDRGARPPAGDRVSPEALMTLSEDAAGTGAPA